MAGLIVFVGIVIVGSALCSSSEAALLSVPILRVRQRAEQGEGRAKTLLAIKERVSRPITTIVVFNNVFNIVGSILVGNQATAVFGSTSLGIVSGVLTFLIIVFSEIIPKTLGERFAEPMSLAIAPAINALTKLFTPIIWLLEHLTRPFSGQSSLADTDEAEIRFLATLGRKQGVIEHDEAEMIQRVFRLNDMTAEEIMTPRVVVTAIEGTKKLSEVIEAIADSPHSRLIIYDESLDKVVGIGLRGSLLAEFARGHGEKMVAELARPAHFVDETMHADDLLRLFQKTREHLVIVVDSYGGTAGVVTLEDVVELVTGDIQDETDGRVDLKAAAKRRRERLLQSGGEPGAP
ncbi:MAG: hemolysin family protein [Spirochaetales bacterium]